MVSSPNFGSKSEFHTLYPTLYSLYITSSTFSFHSVLVVALSCLPVDHLRYRRVLISTAQNYWVSDSRSREIGFGEAGVFQLDLCFLE